MKLEKKPKYYDIRVTNYLDSINLLKLNIVTHISLDHDLGTIMTGYDIAKYIEKMAYFKKINKIKWEIHSANPVGYRNIKIALENANKYWGLF